MSAPSGPQFSKLKAIIILLTSSFELIVPRTQAVIFWPWNCTNSCVYDHESESVQLQLQQDGQQVPGPQPQHQQVQQQLQQQRNFLSNHFMPITPSLSSQNINQLPNDLQQGGLIRLPEDGWHQQNQDQESQTQSQPVTSTSNTNTDRIAWISEVQQTTSSSDQTVNGQINHQYNVDVNNCSCDKILNDPERQKQCVICQESLYDSAEETQNSTRPSHQIVQLHECGHCFHLKPCFLEWFARGKPGTRRPRVQPANRRLPITQQTQQSQTQQTQSQTSQSSGSLSESSQSGILIINSDLSVSQSSQQQYQTQVQLQERQLTQQNDNLSHGQIDRVLLQLQLEQEINEINFRVMQYTNHGQHTIATENREAILSYVQNIEIYPSSNSYFVYNNNQQFTYQGASPQYYYSDQFPNFRQQIEQRLQTRRRNSQSSSSSSSEERPGPGPVNNHSTIGSDNSGVGLGRQRFLQHIRQGLAGSVDRYLRQNLDHNILVNFVRQTMQNDGISDLGRMLDSDEHLAPEQQQTQYDSQGSSEPQQVQQFTTEISQSQQQSDTVTQQQLNLLGNIGYNQQQTNNNYWNQDATTSNVFELNTSDLISRSYSLGSRRLQTVDSQSMQNLNLNPANSNNNSQQVQTTAATVQQQQPLPQGVDPGGPYQFCPLCRKKCYITTFPKPLQNLILKKRKQLGLPLTVHLDTAEASESDNLAFIGWGWADLNRSLQTWLATQANQNSNSNAEYNDLLSSTSDSTAGQLQYQYQQDYNQHSRESIHTLRPESESLAYYEEAQEIMRSIWIDLGVDINEIRMINEIQDMEHRSGNISPSTSGSNTNIANLSQNQIQNEPVDSNSNSQQQIQYNSHYSSNSELESIMLQWQGLSRQRPSQAQAQAAQGSNSNNNTNYLQFQVQGDDDHIHNLNLDVLSFDHNNSTNFNTDRDSRISPIPISTIP